MGILDIKHWVIILVVVLLVFGTKKLKTLGADVGETVKGFRKAMNEDASADHPSTVMPAQSSAAQHSAKVLEESPPKA